MYLLYHIFYLFNSISVKIYVFSKIERHSSHDLKVMGFLAEYYKHKP